VEQAHQIWAFWIVSIWRSQQERGLVDGENVLILVENLHGPELIGFDGPEV